MFSHKISSALFLTIILCFFLPFITKCETKPMPLKHVDKAGERLVAEELTEKEKEIRPKGRTLNGYQFMNEVVEKALDGNISYDNFFIDSIIIVSFLSAVTGFLLGLRKKQKYLFVAIMSGINVVLLFLWGYIHSMFDKIRYGSYCVFVLFIAATILNAYHYRKEKRKGVHAKWT